MKRNNQKTVDRVKKHPFSKVKLAVTDIDGVLRGKYIHKDKFFSALEKGFGFCDVIFGWDANDALYEGIDFTGWHTGYPDARTAIDIATYREVPWDNNVPFFLADFDVEGSKTQAICPRTLVKRIKERAKGMGFKAIFGQEFEWFNFRETPESLKEKHYTHPQPITTGMFGYSLLRANKDYFNDLYDLLEKFGIPLEGLHTETGPGVYEAAILHDDILEASDRAVLFKASVKEIALRHGIMPSFMAKWSDKFPGTSGHLHQSLWEGDRNVFFDEKDPHKMSTLMKSYLAGQLHCLPSLLALYAPTINSYKRCVEGTWAPTTVSWGIDNRTTAIRVLPVGSRGTRIEFRVTGSDVNPYVVMAANLASGLYGIERGLKLDITASEGSGYQDFRHGRLAKTLEEATKIMETSKIPGEILGEDFIHHFIQTRHWEWKQYLKHITDWEIARYFETL